MTERQPNHDDLERLPPSLALIQRGADDSVLLDLVGRTCALGRPK